ncbi:hypothetical protein [Acinetobacter baumannii]|uniref:hypothetical protein n=1 Tax=Acinetobacter baumannii TaxID=470 RepID=UPI0036F6272E
MPYTFDPDKYANPHWKEYFVPEYAILFNERLRAWHPELKTWCDAALFFAWGAYSQDIYAISEADWIDEPEYGFLAYLYVRQENPNFNFGGTGLFDDDTFQLGEEKPWLTHASLPSWCSVNEKGN